MIKLLQEELKNRNVLRKILQNIRFLAKYSLPFCGNWSGASESEEDSNFHWLLLLKSLDDEELVR